MLSRLYKLMYSSPVRSGAGTAEDAGRLGDWGEKGGLLWE